MRYLPGTFQVLFRYLLQLTKSRGQILKSTKSSIISTLKDVKIKIKAEQLMFKLLSKIALLSTLLSLLVLNKGVSSLSYIRKCRFFVSVNLSKLTVTLADYIQIHIHIRTDEAREQNRPLYNLGVIQRWPPDGAVK